MSSKQVRGSLGIAVVLGLWLAFPSEALATRGRVKVANNTIVTDTGSLIRGARVSLDIWDETPSQTDTDTMKNSRGLNAFHIYAEYPGSNKAAGYNSAKVDKVVDMADKSDLYVVLTIGSGGENGKFHQDFVTAFWDFYAPRYKDRTHVVYEICNEPQAWSAPYNSTTLAMEKNGFTQIRGLAPDTHIMLMSYSQPNNATQAANECAGLNISWDNASVAFHTYGIDGKEDSALTSFYNALKGKGIAYACTEPNLTLKAITMKLMERDKVSETQFINVKDIATNASAFTSWVTSNNICWTPDFGTWPSCAGTTPNGTGGSSSNGGRSGNGGSSAISPNIGGRSSNGGSSAISPNTGGRSSNGVGGAMSNGGNPTTGGRQGVGGASTSVGVGGGANPTGGKAAGGELSVAGGTPGVGGGNTGGKASATGGADAAGGNAAVGGKVVGNPTGGAPANGGDRALGGDASVLNDATSDKSGCSCRIGNTQSSAPWSLSLLIGLGLFARRRNKQG
jgi:MYXO-CTERM domain-containing protein